MLGLKVSNTHRGHDSGCCGPCRCQYSSAAMILFAPLARLVLTRFRWLYATGDDRDAEILALRHQITVLQRQINRA